MDKNMKLSSKESMDLPTNIVETILTFLPVRDAVRTSILSQRWRYLWANIPKLVFDDTLCQTSAGNEKCDITKLLFNIYQVLLLHHGPIKEFSLSVSELESRCEIDQLILYLSRRNVMEKFTLCISMGEPYKVPSSLFSCQKLTHLKLHSCVFELPPMMIGGFSSLINLEFDEVIFTAEVLGNFISNCPQLEKMSLISSDVFDYLEIDAPKLRFLHFRLELKSLVLKNVTLLVNVSIVLKEPGKEGFHENSNMIQLFDRIPLIEHLIIGFHFLKSLAVDGVPHKLPTALLHLKSLELSEISLGELDELSFALCLIRSSPNLEKITLLMHTETTQDIGSSVVEFLQAQDFSEVILNQLRSVKVERTFGAHPELEFVKLLLAKSPNLEKMLVEPNLCTLADKGLQMLTAMIQFERASPKAKIIFGNYSPSSTRIQ